MDFKQTWSFNRNRSLAQHVHEEEAPEEAEEEEVVDPKPEVEDSCKPRCVKQLLSYEVRHLFGNLIML